MSPSCLFFRQESSLSWSTWTRSLLWSTTRLPSAARCLSSASFFCTYSLSCFSPILLFHASCLQGLIWDEKLPSGLMRQPNAPCNVAVPSWLRRCWRPNLQYVAKTLCLTWPYRWAVLVLPSHGMLATWHRFCLHRPPVPTIVVQSKRIWQRLVSFLRASLHGFSVKPKKSQTSFQIHIFHIVRKKIPSAGITGYVIFPNPTRDAPAASLLCTLMASPDSQPWCWQRAFFKQCARAPLTSLACRETHSLRSLT